MFADMFLGEVLSLSSRNPLENRLSRCFFGPAAKE